MAWGDQRKLEIKDLTDLGLDPEAIKKTHEAVAGLDDKIKNAVTEANKANGEGLSALKLQLEDIASKLQTKPNNNDDGKGGGGNDDGEQVDWMLDPEKAANKLVNDKVGNVVQIAASMRADMNYNNYKSSHEKPHVFAKFEKEIKEMWEKEPLVNKQHPKLIENIYKIVVANHIDEVAKMGEEFFLPSEGGGKPHGDNKPTKKPEELLSKDELELAAKWGVTPEEYLKEKSGISGVTYA